MQRSNRTAEAQTAFDAAIKEVGAAGEALRRAEKAYEAAKEKARKLRLDLEFEEACDNES
jgi:hypothetical protein